MVVYKTSADGPRVGVILGEPTVWLSLNQIAELFGRDKSVISRHLKAVLDSGELERETAVAEDATTASDGKSYQVTYFNLDAILAVGYRVSSGRGTQFRKWATRTLNEHLLRGYSLDEKRLHDRGIEIERAVALLSTTLRNQDLVTDQGLAVLDVVQRYARSWRMLRAYDEDELPSAPAQTSAPIASLDVSASRETIRTLRDDMIARGENPGMFGQERGDALESILLNIEQTWGGEALYPTTRSRTATSGRGRCCSSTTCAETARCVAPTADRASRTRRSWRSRCSSRRATHRTRTS